VEGVIGIFRFSRFGSLSLFPYTMDCIKDLTTINKSIAMYSFDVIWVMASIGVMSRLQRKNDFDYALCKFTGHLSIAG
jgi:hypothetical protein